MDQEFLPNTKYNEYKWPPAEVDKNDPVFPYICRDGLKQFISEQTRPLFLVIGGDANDEERLKKGLATKGFTCIYMNFDVGQVIRKYSDITYPDDIPNDLVLADFNNYYHLKALAECFPSTFDHIMFDYGTGYICEWHDDAFYVEIMKLLKPGGTFTNPCIFSQHGARVGEKEDAGDVGKRFVFSRHDDEQDKTFDEKDIGINTRHRVELYNAGPPIDLNRSIFAGAESVTVMLRVCHRYWKQHFERMTSYVSTVEFIREEDTWFGPTSANLSQRIEESKSNPLHGKERVMVLTKPTNNNTMISGKEAKSYRHAQSLLKECIMAGRERELSRFMKAHLTPSQYREYRRDLKKAGSACRKT